MTIPFTYYLLHKPTGLKYYGVRYKKGCHPDDLWNKYFSSSKDVKQLIEQYGLQSFEVEVRKTFGNIKSAKDWEHKVLSRLKVISKKDWLNKSYGYAPSTSGFKYSEESRKKMSEWQLGENNPFYGKKHTPEAKAKIAEASRNRIHKDETRKKLSIASKKRGISSQCREASHSKQAKEKRRNSMLGQKRSIESKEKMRQARIAYLMRTHPKYQNQKKEDEVVSNAYI